MRPLSPPDVRIPEVIALKNEILQQYIRLTDIKLMLKGKVTVDLN